MRIVFPFLLALVGLVSQGCIRPVTVVKEEPPAATAADTASVAAEPFDPISLGGDVFEEELEIGEAPAPREIFGYRVQIGAFGDESSAQVLKGRAVEDFGERVYVIHQEPFWCVRLGDFETIAQAEAAKKEAIAAGHAQARVVQDKIIVRE